MTIKNINVWALDGDNTTDMEIIEEYKLDPSLAGKKELNDVMLERSYQDNIKGQLAEGKTEAQAKSFAGKRKAMAKKKLLDLYKAHNI